MSADGWCITSLLGRGTHGATYLALAEDGSRVAIKVILTGGDETMVSDLARLADEVGMIDDPRVMRWRAVEADSGRALLVMDYAPGGSLGDALRRSGRVPPSTILRWAAEASHALAAAHRRGLVHGDLKPTALLIGGSGEPMVADFGLSSVVAGSSGTGTGGGCLDYRDPWLAGGHGPDERSDVFSFSLVLFEALCWAREPVAADPARLFFRRSGSLRLERLPDDVPVTVAELIGQATDPDRARRPASGVELAALLGEAAAALPVLDAGGAPSISLPRSGGATAETSNRGLDAGRTAGDGQAFGRPRRLRRAHSRLGVEVELEEDPAGDVVRPLGDEPTVEWDEVLLEGEEWDEPTGELVTEPHRTKHDRRAPRRSRYVLVACIALAALLTALATSTSRSRSSEAAGPFGAVGCHLPASTAFPGYRVGTVSVGQGCPHAVLWSGNVATVVDSSGRPAMRFSFGEGGQLLVGRWDCRRGGSPALYEPSTGVVYLYAGWASFDEPNRPYASLATGVRDGVASVTHRGACDRVMVEAKPLRRSR